MGPSTWGNSFPLSGKVKDAHRRCDSAVVHNGPKCKNYQKPVESRADKFRHIHTLKCYAAMRMNEVRLHRTIRMKETYVNEQKKQDAHTYTHTFKLKTTKICFREARIVGVIQEKVTIKVRMAIVSWRDMRGTSKRVCWEDLRREGVLFLLVAQGFTFSLSGTYIFYVLFWRHVLFHNLKKRFQKDKWVITNLRISTMNKNLKAWRWPETAGPITKQFFWVFCLCFFFCGVFFFGAWKVNFRKTNDSLCFFTF